MSFFKSINPDKIVKFIILLLMLAFVWSGFLLLETGSKRTFYAVIASDKFRKPGSIEEREQPPDRALIFSKIRLDNGKPIGEKSVTKFPYKYKYGYDYIKKHDIGVRNAGTGKKACQWFFVDRTDYCDYNFIYFSLDKQLKDKELIFSSIKEVILPDVYEGGYVADSTDTSKTILMNNGFLIDVETGSGRLITNEPVVSGAKFFDGKQFVLFCQDVDKCELMTIDTNGKIRKYPAGQVYSSGFYHPSINLPLTVSPDGKIVALKAYFPEESDEKKSEEKNKMLWLCLFDSSTGKIEKRIPEKYNFEFRTRTFLEWNPAHNSTLIASGDESSGVIIYDIKDNTSIRISYKAPTALRWMDNGKYLGYIIDGQAFIYDLKTGTNTLLMKDKDAFDILWVWERDKQ
ncbi:MAG: hypothetical protein LWY06_17880 [Firmicutes bacterium]|nr:hypothetical protein [Bacillota bacterium]